MDETIREYMRQIGSKGGKATGGAKAESSRLNGIKGGGRRRKQYPEGSREQKNQAAWIANRAMDRGKLDKQPCSQCGEPIAQKHHPDYSKPLEVVWLCRKCHTLEHVRLRAEAKKNAQLPLDKGTQAA